VIKAEDVRVLILKQKDIENPFGDYSGNLTSHLIRHPELISKSARFVQTELSITNIKRLQTTSIPLRADLVFEDENNIYLVEVKEDQREVEDGKRQVLQYVRIFKEDLQERKVSLTKTVVPIVAGPAQE